MPEMMALRKLVSEKYTELYEQKEEVPGFRAAVNAFDAFLANPANRNFVGDYVNTTGDIIMSDREAAAFMMVLSEFMEKGEPLYSSGETEK